MEPRRATPADIPAIVALTDAAYRPNEAIIGVASLPRIADYDEVLAQHEVWLVDDPEGLAAVLVLEIEPEDFTIWSIAVSPQAAGRKLGAALMAFAEAQARSLGRNSVHLYTHEKLSDRIAWYERQGYASTHHEDLPDRRLVHMRKTLS